MKQTKTPEKVRPPHEVRKVPMWSRESATGNVVLQTTGLTACTGIAIYDSRTGVGYMGHFFSPQKEPEFVESFLDSAASAALDLADLQVWVRGNELLGDHPGQVSRFEVNRDYVLSELAKRGLIEDSIDVEWSNTGETVFMSLDCETGEFHALSNVA